MSSSRTLAMSVAAAALCTSGCNSFVESLEDGGALVNVFSAHHATPEDGRFPLRGDDDMPRIFENDLGQEVTLLESFVVITGVTLIKCSGNEAALNMFWGPCPEDMSQEDLETLTVAGRDVGSGDYCELIVHYGPYTTPEMSDDTETQHRIPGTEAVDGSSIYLRGAGRFDPDEDAVQFELRSTESFSVRLDLSQIEDGDPMNVAHREDFPVELTVSKTYDRFFDGIDFDALDQASLEASLPATLGEQTKVSPGSVVLMQE